MQIFPLFYKKTSFAPTKLVFRKPSENTDEKKIPDHKTKLIDRTYMWNIFNDKIIGK